ncbi:alanine--tRNA ligase [Candidatus Micrarchaeota archaeon]|nr:alanine--tRNA ligase [Candidatus Micrarchaeota archaeon]
MTDKDKLRKEFSKDWKKHYDVKIFKEHGFTRQKCKKCGKHFWSSDERDYCADSSCIGYEFIGDAPSPKKLSYIDTWKTIEKYFTKNGHKSIKSYPTVARWRDDLYFTVASINDFQPYVVNGEIEPPGNPLIVPQHCIRFPDIANVGVTGRHYTNFVMVGQHAFNTKKSGLFYWKDEALDHDIKMLKALGIREEKLVFIEDVWAGGGNFGPCLEYFAGGLELGNCVFMQYEELPDGKTRELNTKVIDMGAGLERLAWITHGTPTSYEIVFGPVIRELKDDFKVKVDNGLFERFSKLCGSLNIDEVKDLEKEKDNIAIQLGTTKEELFSRLEPLQALYATADHTLTVLSAVTDGMLPSNAGGGYNLRLILRRMFAFENEFGFSFNYYKILEGHAKHLSGLFPELSKGVEVTDEIIKEEKEKYGHTMEKAKGKVQNIIKKSKGGISLDSLITLYRSEGVPPEYVAEIARKEKIPVSIPGKFYDLVREKDEVQTKKEEKKDEISADTRKFEKTKGLFYDENAEFTANIIGIFKDYIILDRTAFYPEGGGQTADAGWINEEKVVDVKKKDGVIFHLMEKPTKLKKGQKVKGIVDVKRRKTIARHHTGAHMLNAACREILGNHIWQAGSYKDEKKAHLDVTHFRRITDKELDLVESKVNEYIMRNAEIKTEILPRNKAEEEYGFGLYQGGAVPGKELRVVVIEGIDAEACGGTHQMIKRTGEIGVFKIIKREGVQDGIERIVYKCGSVAVGYIQEREKMLKSAASEISVSEYDLQRSVARFFKEWKEQKKTITRLKKSVAKNEFDRLSKNKDRLHIVDYDAEMLREISMNALQAGTYLAVANKDGDAVVSSGDSKTDALELLKKINKQLGGSGGGSAKFAQGKIKEIKGISL